MVLVANRFRSCAEEVRSFFLNTAKLRQADFARKIELDAAPHRWIRIDFVGASGVLFLATSSSLLGCTTGRVS